MGIRGVAAAAGVPNVALLGAGTIVATLAVVADLRLGSRAVHYFPHLNVQLVKSATWNRSFVQRNFLWGSQLGSMFATMMITSLAYVIPSIAIMVPRWWEVVMVAAMYGLLRPGVAIVSEIGFGRLVGAASMSRNVARVVAVVASGIAICLLWVVA